MKQFADAIDACTASENWYGALFIALSLPDICGKIDQPNAGSRSRYASWFDERVAPKYTHNVGASSVAMTFLSGNDCYALRCAYLHEGSGDISEQKAKEVVEKFHFVVPPKGHIIHSNMIDDTLQLQVDIFCNDVQEGVLAWTAAAREDPRKRAATDQLLKIQFPSLDGSIEIHNPRPMT